MKKFLISLYFLSLTSSVFAKDIIYSAKVTENQVPVEVVIAVEKDFKGYASVEYFALTVTLVDDKVTVAGDKNFASIDYNSYQVTLSWKNTTMKAYYDAEGHLVSAYESIEDVVLPRVVDRAIANKYCKAKLDSDRYVATHYTKEGKATVHYHVKIINNGKMHPININIDGNGNIIRG